MALLESITLMRSTLRVNTHRFILNPNSHWLYLPNCTLSPAAAQQLATLLAGVKMAEVIFDLQENTWTVQQEQQVEDAWKQAVSGSVSMEKNFREWLC